MYGYHGRALVVDLTHRTHRWDPIPENALRGFIGDEESARVYTMVTGWEMSSRELRQAGERINNLKKLFNVREGWRRADDTLPPRVLQERLPSGGVAGVGLTQQELDYRIDGYYRARGWTEEGLVPLSKQAELGLDSLLPQPSDSLAAT